MPAARVHRWLALPAGLLLLALAACSTPKTNEPAELVDFDAILKVDKLWSTGIGDGQGKAVSQLLPAIRNGVVYAASADGVVEALDLEEGDSLWDVGIEAELTAGVGLGDNTVVVGTRAGELISLAADTGAFLWVAELGSQVESAPVSDGERIYVQTVDGKVIAVDAANGNRLWAYDGQMPVLTQRGSSSPVLAAGTVLAGLANGKLVCLDARTGQLRWEGRVAVPQGRSEIDRLVDVDGDPLVLGGRVVAVSLQGNLVAFSQSSGRPEWRLPASSHVSPTQGFGNLYVVEANGAVKAFDPEQVVQRWEQGALAWRGLTAAVPLSSYLLLGDREGYVHVLSQVDGSFAARFRLDRDGIAVPPVVADDIAVVYGNGGKLMAFRLRPKR